MHRVISGVFFLMTSLLCGMSFMMSGKADDDQQLIDPSYYNVYQAGYWNGFGGWAPAGSVVDNSYPKVTAVRANHTTTVNGKTTITTDTNKLWVTYQTAKDFAFNRKYPIESLVLDIVYDKESDPPKSITVKNKYTNLATGQASVKIPSSTLQYDVNLTNLYDKYRDDIAIAMRMRLKDGSQGTYAIARLTRPVLSRRRLIIDSPTTNTVLSGRGTPGCTISIDGYPDVQPVTVDGGGKYQFNLKAPLDQTRPITVKKTNPRVGAKPIFCTLAAPLTIVVNKPTLILTAQDFAKMSKAHNDSTALNWIVDQQAVTVSNPNVPTEKLQVLATQTNLYQRLNALKNGQSLTVELYGKSQNNGQTKRVKLTIYKNAVLLSLNVTSISFGTATQPITVPLTTKRFHETGLSVLVTDKRLTGKWYLNATLVKPIQPVKKKGAPLGLYYLDSVQHELSANSIRIAEGQAGDNSTTNVGMVKHWSAANKGFFLKVPPSVQTGEYRGVIQWDLQDVAAQ